VDEFARVFFHVNFLDAYLFYAAFGSVDFNVSVGAYRHIKLRYLVCLGQIRIKVVFTVKFDMAVDGAVGRQPARIAYSSTRRLSTGRVPGMPEQTSHTWVFGSPPNRVVHPQKILEAVDNSVCTSRPMTVS
jgi:hypothetical protein